MLGQGTPTRPFASFAPTRPALAACAGSLRQARRVQLATGGSQGWLEGPCGHPGYASPEVLSWIVDGTRRTPYGFAADVWSLGVLLYTMLCGLAPFRGESPAQLLRAMTSKKVDFPAQLEDGSATCWARVSLAAKDLVQQMLQLDPAARPSVEGALQHAWIQDVYDRDAVRAAVVSLREWEKSRVQDWSATRGDRVAWPARSHQESAAPWRLREQSGGAEEAGGRGPLRLISSWLNGWLRGRQHRRVLLLGLDGGGKSTLLEQFKRQAGSEPARPAPTIGHDIAHFERGACSFTVCDIGGQRRARTQWARYLTSGPDESSGHVNESQAIVFVVDAADPARLPEAREELEGLLRDPRLHKTALLVFVNKMDVDGALSVADVGDKLGLSREPSDRRCGVRGGSTRTGEGAVEVLDWVAATGGA